MDLVHPGGPLGEAPSVHTRPPLRTIHAGRLTGHPRLP